jgi:hypothetical protein
MELDMLLKLNYCPLDVAVLVAFRLALLSTLSN